MTHIRNRDAPYTCVRRVTALRCRVKAPVGKPAHATLVGAYLFPGPCLGTPSVTAVGVGACRKIYGDPGGARASGEGPEKKRDEGARRRRRRCTSHVLLGPSRIDCPEVCSSPRLVWSYASYSAACGFSREREILVNGRSAAVMSSRYSHESALPA